MKKKSLLLLLWLIFSAAIQGQTLIHEFNFNGNQCKYTEQYDSTCVKDEVFAARYKHKPGEA